MTVANKTEIQNAPPAKGAFVIHPEPTAEPLMSQDGIYAGNTAAYVEAVTRENSANTIQAASIMICGNVCLLSDRAVEKAAQVCNVIVAGRRPAAAGVDFCRNVSFSCIFVE